MCVSHTTKNKAFICNLYSYVKHWWDSCVGMMHGKSPTFIILVLYFFKNKIIIYHAQRERFFYPSSNSLSTEKKTPIESILTHFVILVFFSRVCMCVFEFYDSVCIYGICECILRYQFRSFSIRNVQHCFSTGHSFLLLLPSAKITSTASLEIKDHFKKSPPNPTRKKICTTHIIHNWAEINQTHLGVWKATNNRWILWWLPVGIDFFAVCFTLFWT